MCGTLISPPSPRNLLIEGSSTSTAHMYMDRAKVASVSLSCKQGVGPSYLYTSLPLKKVRRSSVGADGVSRATRPLGTLATPPPWMFALPITGQDVTPLMDVTLLLWLATFPWMFPPSDLLPPPPHFALLTVMAAAKYLGPFGQISCLEIHMILAPQLSVDCIRNHQRPGVGKIGLLCLFVQVCPCRSIGQEGFRKHKCLFCIQRVCIFCVVYFVKSRREAESLDPPLMTSKQKWTNLSLIHNSAVNWRSRTSTRFVIHCFCPYLWFFKRQTLVPYLVTENSSDLCFHKNVAEKKTTSSSNCSLAGCLAHWTRCVWGWLKSWLVGDHVATK